MAQKISELTREETERVSGGDGGGTSTAGGFTGPGGTGTGGGTGDPLRDGGGTSTSGG